MFLSGQVLIVLDFMSSRASRWNDTKIFSDFADENEDSDGDYMDAGTHGRSKASSLLKSKASGLRLVVVIYTFWH